MTQRLYRSGLAITLVTAALVTGCATNLQRGEQAEAAGDYKMMLQHCQMATEEKNPPPLAFKCIGNAQVHLGNRSAARSAYVTYLSKIPDDVDARLTLAKLYIDQGSNEAAQSQLEKLLTFDSANYEAYYLLGEIYRVAVLCKNARASYARTLEIKPDYFAAKAGQERLEKACSSKPKKRTERNDSSGRGIVLPEGRW